MAQHLLLTAFCILVVVYTTVVEGASTCRNRCTARCRVQKRLHANKQTLMACLNGCYGLPKNCQKCSALNKKCSKCLPGFRFSGNNRCIPCPTGCKCGSKGDCPSCLSGFIMTANGCTACPSGCNCDPTTAKCLSCRTGYVASALPTDPPCLACPANCDVCSTTGPTGCITCKASFSLIGGVCQPCTPNCDSCLIAGAGSCDTCQTGYKKTTSGSTKTCEACPANCFSCEIFNTSYCDACIEGYGLNSDRTKCVACSPNCKTCNWNGYNSCDSPQCASGYGYDSMAGTCTIECSDGCETCSSESVCLKCKAGYTLQADASCLSTSTGCSGNVPFCVSCTSGTTCGQCVSGYGLKGDGTGCGSCVTETTEGCISCTFDSTPTITACTKCADGYIAKTGAGAIGCWPCKVGCKDCTSANMDTTTGKCLTCYNGVAPTADGDCVSKSGSTASCDKNCAPPYCAVNGDNKCDLNCVAGYYLQTTDHTCQPCTSGTNCKHCTVAAGTCDGPQCKTGYSLTADNKCQAN